MQSTGGFPWFLVVEETDSGEGHYHVVFVTTIDDCVVSYGTTWFCDVGYTALMGTFDVVGEWEEGIGAKGDTSHLV